MKEIGVSDRIRRRVEKVPELAVSMQENGQIQAITVRPATIEEKEENGDKPWQLVTGGRRLGAAILLGWAEIRADDLGDLSPYRQKVIELEENLQREDMHFADVLAAKERIHELYKAEAEAAGKDWRIEDTAKALGESVGNLSKDLATAKEIGENPELRKSSSKKAAVTSIKMRNHAKAENFRTADQKKFVLTLKRQVVTADAQDWLNTQETGSANLALVDFPYGIDYFDMPRDNEEVAGEFDDSPEKARDLITDVIPKLVRSTAPTGWMVFFAGWEGYFFVRDCLSNVCAEHFEYFVEGFEMCPKATGKRATCSRLKLPPKPWIWLRPNSRNNAMHPDLYAKNLYEPFIVVNRGLGKLSGEEASKKGNVLVYDAEYEDRIHAHQKPVPLGQDLIERFTQFDQRVVDCCFGSGAFLAAAARSSRDFAGCDNNPLMLNPALGKIAMEYKGDAKEEPVPF